MSKKKLDPIVQVCFSLSLSLLYRADYFDCRVLERYSPSGCQTTKSSGNQRALTKCWRNDFLFPSSTDYFRLTGGYVCTVCMYHCYYYDGIAPVCSGELFNHRLEKSLNFFPRPRRVRKKKKTRPNQPDVMDKLCGSPDRMVFFCSST